MKINKLNDIEKLKVFIKNIFILFNKKLAFEIAKILKIKLLIYIMIINYDEKIKEKFQEKKK